MEEKKHEKTSDSIIIKGKMAFNKEREMKGPNYPFTTIDQISKFQHPQDWRNVPVPLVEFSVEIIDCLDEIKKKIHQNYNDVSIVNSCIGLNDRNIKRELLGVRCELYDAIEASRLTTIKNL